MSKIECLQSANGKHFPLTITARDFNDNHLRYVEERCAECGKMLDAYEERLIPTGKGNGEWRRK